MLDFLSLLAPAIHLVAITPDGPALGRWFGSDVAGAASWAQEQNGAGRNIYFTVNVVREGLNTKPRKADIVAVRFAHVDIDPPESGAWDRDAAVGTLRTRGAPSVIIDSGNGFQGLWALTSPAADVETINRGLIEAFDTARGTHNIDRLLRVPDTINYPNAAKLKAGRTVTAATLLTVTAARYTPESLSAAFPYTAAAAASAGADEIDDIPYVLLSPDDLVPPPSAQLRALIDADIPTGQRSEHVSRVVAQMGREGHDDAQVLGILLNPALAVSGHVLDQPNPERAARRKAALAAPHRIDVATIFGSAPTIPTQALTEPPTTTAARETGIAPRNGGVMFVDQQMRHFEGCTYVVSLDKVMMPSGTLLNQSRFDSVMGGHSFILDRDNSKMTSGAWEAFLKNQNFIARTADERCFRPSEPARALITSGNRALVNTYVPIETPRREGDPSKFLNWLAVALPDPHDRQILLTYLASLLQNPGRKFSWWPVLQSAEGTGKGFIMEMLVHCIGQQYCHLPNTSKMTRNGINFNGWIEGKLFVGLNEIYSAKRRDFLEELKTTVTDSRIPIEGKGIEEATLDNYANGLLFTNHQDGVPVTIDMRRYCVLFMALQSHADILAAGLTDAFFADFWDWGYGRGKYAAGGENYGFAVLNDYLRKYQCVAELDPAQLAGRAPKTSSTISAVRASLGQAEQEVLEAIDQSLPGFAGGWVSSIMLDKLLEARRIHVPRGKRKALMESLGYHYHPALPDGRTHNAVSPDNGKPRLYVKVGHLADQNVDKAADAARLYQEAQARSASDVAGAVLNKA